VSAHIAPVARGDPEQVQFTAERIGDAIHVFPGSVAFQFRKAGQQDLLLHQKLRYTEHCEESGEKRNDFVTDLHKGQQQACLR